jgi:hypothetical protein
MLTFLKLTCHNCLTRFAFLNSHHVPPALTRLPNYKANPPSTHCTKPTNQMATYVTTPDNVEAPFDAMHNAVLTLHTLLYMLQSLMLLLTLKLLK